MLLHHLLYLIPNVTYKYFGKERENVPQHVHILRYYCLYYVKQSVESSQWSPTQNQQNMHHACKQACYKTELPLLPYPTRFPDVINFIYTYV